ncbi:zinc ABC transporter substrate-binding protein [Vibrio vulnificus]|uniref:metal ABC transporter solute-binding protein, Zn/Mn family n=1 Tax=Vibrio vulnificus TaxID=672 RepID=UPI0005F2732D|nr:zinc ABC transporter substrate-binding protein [Vibrio vulnificus]EHH2448707.1 zinc ABC transporter solute-binding protein [Vibrio vulnificus]EHZ2654720.1 zinc ABC transporter substrate-binding protein [Vibrio vulnificus]EIZ4669052.1 zinc ABC transporter substrate-binding protein [Vibrio vulnificus]ELA4931134.1 zinc ABC transporter substrate-binding protein [Vibrio vulnificus]HDY7693943.1 zinc ABC transporter substrate-binding protein [Vibrio vulnificus]
MLMRFSVCLSLLLLSMPSIAGLNVFVCQPDWADLVRQHAPDARIYSATTAMQDPHYVQARPSLIAQMRRADLVVCSGAELEIGWLPELQRQSRNPKVQNGQTGLLWVSDYVQMLDKHEQVDRAMGDVHAHGNPHVQFALADMPAVSRALADRLALIDPDNQSLYKGMGVKFRHAWQKRLSVWREQARPLRGMQVVGYHQTYRYLYAWLGIEQVADLEPKPGLPPTMAHLQKLNQLDLSQVSGIVYSSHQPVDSANWLAQRSQLPIVQLAQSVGGRAQASDLIALIDDSIAQLLQLRSAL